MASDTLRQFMATGSSAQKRAVAEVINNICGLTSPLDFNFVSQELAKLTKIRQTILGPDIIAQSLLNQSGVIY